MISISPKLNFETETGSSAGPLRVAVTTISSTLAVRGELVPARTHLEQGIALYDSQRHQTLAFSYASLDPGVNMFSHAALILWQLGYPEQALTKSHEALSLAHEISHPISLASALVYVAVTHQWRRELAAVQERAETAMTLSTEHGFSYWLTYGTMLRGGAESAHGQITAGIVRINEGLAAWQATGTGFFRSLFLALLAEAYGNDEQVEAGLSTVAEALAFVERTEERFVEAELHRLKGELLLQQPQAQQGEAETCFHRAIEVARHQQAKSWELRAAMSLAKLWQSQGKTAEACDLLAPVYNWFAEGFDTADLKDAKALLTELS